MLHEDKIKRINELAKKSKSEGLTNNEKDEQHHLREEYLKSIRESFTNQFKSMTVVDPEGTDVTPKKVKDLQKKKNEE